jgi:MFS family permease
VVSILADRTYRHLFLAQVIALLGTGLATVALGLLAYDLAGDRASAVLGTVFAIQMIGYVAIAPIAGAFANRLPRRMMLAGLAEKAKTTAPMPMATVDQNETSSPGLCILGHPQTRSRPSPVSLC